MTTAGRAHSKPWRVSWYMRDPVTGRPVNARRRAFLREPVAASFAADRREEGYTAECWRVDVLPGMD